MAARYEDGNLYLINLLNNYLTSSIPIINYYCFSKETHGFSLRNDGTGFGVLARYDTDNCIILPHTCPHGFTLAFYTKLTAINVEVRLLFFHDKQTCQILSDMTEMKYCDWKWDHFNIVYRSPSSVIFIELCLKSSLIECVRSVDSACFLCSPAPKAYSPPGTTLLIHMEKVLFAI